MTHVGCEYQVQRETVESHCTDHRITVLALNIDVRVVGRMTYVDQKVGTQLRSVLYIYICVCVCVCV